MSIHVSIHDVSPAWTDEVERALELTDAYGVRPALLVVPNFHGRAPLSDNPAFCERLRALQAAGHEVYLHGFYHQARAWEQARNDNEPDGGPHPSSLRRAGARARHAIAQTVVSSHEAEFSDVSREQAAHRLDEGERVLRDAGLVIQGFVAPAWSMPSWGYDLLGERGYTYSEDHTRVIHPAERRSRRSVVLNYASRSPARLLASVAWCRVARPARRWLPARIAIHPADMGLALLRREIEALLAWAAGDICATGAELIA